MASRYFEHGVILSFLISWILLILKPSIAFLFFQGDNQDLSAVMNDPEFLQHLVSSLPGVNPNSEAVRNALGSLTQLSEDKSSKDSKKDEKKQGDK